MLRTRKDVNSGNFSRCKTLGRVWFRAWHFHLNLRNRCPCIVFHHMWELYYWFCHNWLLSWTFLWNLSSCCWLPTPPLSKRRSSLRFKMCRVDQTWPILCAFTNSQMSRFGCIQSYRKSHNLGLGCKLAQETENEQNGCMSYRKSNKAGNWSVHFKSWKDCDGCTSSLSGFHITLGHSLL